MASSGKSVRLMVDHWLAPAAGQHVRVAAFINNRLTDKRYVCVDALKPGAPWPYSSSVIEMGPGAFIHLVGNSLRCG